MYVGGFDTADNCTKARKHCQKLGISENQLHDDFDWPEHRNDISLLKLNETLKSKDYIEKINIVPREKNIKGVSNQSR